MECSIETLLIRNLHEVFGEHDRVLRAGAMRSLFTPDCLFCDPRGSHHGYQALEAAVDGLMRQFPDHVFTAIGRADSVRDCGRLAWAFGPLDEPRRITGLDVILVENGRIAALYTFLDIPAA